MPTFTVKLYEIRLRQELFSQECINLFYYKDDETGPAIGLSQIGISFNSDVLSLMEAIQNENVLGVDIRTRLMGGGVENVQNIDTQTGDKVGESTASFNAWGYILNRTNIDIRNGAKRVAGVSEGDVDGNFPVSGMQTDLDAVAVAFQQTLILANDAELTPVIFRRGSFTDPDWFGSIVADAAFRKVTSQVSRKFKLE
jgi:hypothetical protein